MTSEIQQNRYDMLIRRVGGLIGPGSKVSEVISELFPMFDVENMPAELLRLAGTRICIGGGTLAATAGVAGTAVLENPAGSGMLVTLERVDFAMSAVKEIRWGVQNGFRATAVAIGTEDFRDVREFAPDQPTANVRQIAEVALANGTNQTRAIGNAGFVLDPPNSVCVLPPGTSFEIGCGGVNIAIFYGFSWRERVAEQSELNL